MVSSVMYKVSAGKEIILYQGEYHGHGWQFSMNQHDGNVQS